MMKKILLRWLLGKNIIVFVKPSDHPRLWNIEVADSKKRRKILTGQAEMMSSSRYHLKDYQLYE